MNATMLIVLRARDLVRQHRAPTRQELFAMSDAWKALRDAVLAHEHEHGIVDATEPCEVIAFKKKRKKK